MQSVTDPLNHVTSSQYDALNRLKEVTDPGLGVTQYAYNGLDALTTQTDAKRHVTTYAYVPSFSWLPTPGWNNDPPNK